MSFSEAAREYLWLCIVSRTALYRGLAVIVVVLAAWIIQAYAFIPLRQVPGPWTSRFYALRERTGRPFQGKDLLRLHRKYGIAHIV